MNLLQEKQIQCPYCGEFIEVLIDCSVPHQVYVEDCQVCCRPINFDISISGNGETTLTVSDENS